MIPTTIDQNSLSKNVHDRLVKMTSIMRHGLARAKQKSMMKDNPASPAAKATALIGRMLAAKVKKSDELANGAHDQQGEKFADFVNDRYAWIFDAVRIALTAQNIQQFRIISSQNRAVVTSLKHQDSVVGILWFDENNYLHFKGRGDLPELDGLQQAIKQEEKARWGTKVNFVSAKQDS